MLKNQDILINWIYEPSIVLLYIEIYCYLI